MKICKWCNNEQPLTEFYIGKKWAVQDKCRTCYKSAWSKRFQKVKSIHNIYKKNYYKNHPKFREDRKKYYMSWYRKNGRNRSDIEMESILRWKQEHPKEVRAQSKLRREVYKGNIIKPKKCSVCYVSTKLNAHHEDYDKPLEVIWLCFSCHKKLHTYHSISL